MVAAVWRLSEGTIAANGLRPVAERWLAAQVRGGRAEVGSVEIAWFAPARSLGLQLGEVRLDDGAGRPVLRAKRLDAGLALQSLAGLAPSPGRLAVEDFFAAVSVSPQGRYALGYDASGAPAKGGGDLWRVFDDLTGRPRAERPLSFLEQLDLARGEIALREIGGPVAWRGQVTDVRFDKTGGRLDASADLRIGPAAMTLRAKGVVGLRQALLQGSVAGLDPARVFPWAGATAALSTLDAPVQGRGWLSWSTDRGMEGADLGLTAGAGSIRLGGSPTSFGSGELRADFDPKTRQMLIERLSASSDQADFDMSGRAWLRPESRASGPARWELMLASRDARLSLAPGVAPVAIRGFSLAGGYVPARRRLETDLRFTAGDSPVRFTAAFQRPRRAGSTGIHLDGRIDGMLTPAQVVALWPGELSPEVRSWVGVHVKSGRLGHAIFQVRLPPGSVLAYHAIPNGRLRISYQFDDADIAVDGVPLIQHAVGTGLVQGDRYDMDVQSASIQGVGLSEGWVRVPRLSGEGRRLEVTGRAQGDARSILQVVDSSTAGMASVHGFQPTRLSGQGDVRFSLGRSLDPGPDDFTAAFQGVVRTAAISDAALGMALKSPSMALEGSTDHLSVKGDVELGPYRGPLQYEASFERDAPMLQRAAFNGVLDASSLGLSGPGGSSLPFAARFDDRGGAGQGVIRSKAFSGQTSWATGSAARFLVQGAMNADALRAVGVPLARAVPDRAPVRLVLTHGPSAWTGVLDADLYSGMISVSDGAVRRIRYATQLTPERAQRLGLGGMAADGKPVAVSLDIAAEGQGGSVSYGLGSSSGQVNWSAAPGGRTQYRWRTTLTAADLHAFGLPPGIDPTGPLPVDVSLSSAGGVWSGSADLAGGSIRFSASAPLRGRRRLDLSGALSGDAMADLGLGPRGMIAGPVGVSAVLDLGQEGVRGGHVETDLQRAAFSAPFVSWRKPAGRAMTVSADFARQDGGISVTDLRGGGPGFGLAGSGQWSPKAGGVVRISNAKLEGAFDGSLELALDGSGQRLTTRARYFDARELLQQGGHSGPAAAGGHAKAAAKSLHIDADLAQVRVSDQAMIRNVRIVGEVGPGDRRDLQVGVTRDDGASLVALHIFPDASGMAVSGEVSDVGEAAFVVFGKRAFRGGQARVNGHLVDGGADLHVEMTKVRLVHAPTLARILTVGSLHGLSDTLNGAGIEFTKVIAPVSVRGARLSIGRARATGPAMGITTQGVIDADAHSVDLSGDIAPSYVLNSAMGAVPVVGKLLVSHKGEGMFGLTYSARGAFDQPKVVVNPLSLAAPGILRRIFEERASRQIVAGG